ncbi:MAG: glutathione peroxidase [Flavicella sp.]
MKLVVTTLTLVTFLVGSHFYTNAVNSNKNTVTDNIPPKKTTIYNYKVNDIEGNTFDFSSLKGKKIMVVNTASKCGLTGQYEALQEIYLRYKDLGFVVVGFPSNDFLWQEPGTASEIASFCKKNYGVTFPIMSKIKVKGSKMHEIYHFLTEKSINGFADSKVKWNFQKYLINRAGELEKIISPGTSPNAPEIIDWIKK